MLQNHPFSDIENLSLAVWPVLVRLLLVLLLEGRDHHHHPHLLLHDHLPEVLETDSHLGSLGSDEPLLAACQGDQGGVDVSGWRIA